MIISIFVYFIKRNKALFFNVYLKMITIKKNKLKRINYKNLMLNKNKFKNKKYHKKIKKFKKIKKLFKIKNPH